MSKPPHPVEGVQLQLNEKNITLFGLSEGKLSIAGKMFIICFNVHSEVRSSKIDSFIHFGRLMISIHCVPSMCICYFVFLC